MPRIFISYRRADSSTVSGRIYDHLTRVYGKRNVFKDVDDIPPGSDFRRELERAVAACNIMLVIVGPAWEGAADAQGNLRLHDPGDFVRIEVETALRLPTVTVIPVLVHNASMPAEANLPSTLH